MGIPHTDGAACALSLSGGLDGLGTYRPSPVPSVPPFEPCPRRHLSLPVFAGPLPLGRIPPESTVPIGA